MIKNRGKVRIIKHSQAIIPLELPLLGEVTALLGRPTWRCREKEREREATTSCVSCSFSCLVFSVLVLCSVWDRVSCNPSGLDLSMEQRRMALNIGFSCFRLLDAGIIHVFHGAQLRGCCGQSPGLHTCWASALLTELHSQPRSAVLIKSSRVHTEQSDLSLIACDCLTKPFCLDCDE